MELWINRVRINRARPVFILKGGSDNRKRVIKNSLSFCFSLSFPYYLLAELWIVILEVWPFIIWQVNNNTTLLHCWLKNWPFSHKKSAELQSGSICTRKCCRIKNCQTSKCCRFVICQITQTQTETETEAVRSHENASFRVRFPLEWICPWSFNRWLFRHF